MHVEMEDVLPPGSAVCLEERDAVGVEPDPNERSHFVRRLGDGGESIAVDAPDIVSVVPRDHECVTAGRWVSV